jgi:hypothetical protein
MKQYFKITLFLILLSIQFFSCKKKSEEINNTIPPDDIVYTDFSPDTSFTSVRTWINTGMGTFPVPSDSSAGMGLDFDQDSIINVYVGINTFYEFVSASNPEANYNYSANLAPAQPNDSIASESMGQPKAKIFKKDSIIPGNSTFYWLGIMYGEGVSTFHVPAPQGDAYFGFKIAKSGGYQYGWVLLRIDSWSKILTIKEYAINRTLNKPIMAGQIK